ncbi:MAG: PhoU domain-containing protein [bacterium]|nr:phosphate uptake regulator PhoU [bacterium]
MILLKEIDQNYRFLVSEIIKQMNSVRLQLEKPDQKNLEKVEGREDYIDILKNIIENKCFSRLITVSNKNDNKRAVNITRAVHTITVNLERIGDFCVNIMRQFKYFENPEYMVDRYDTATFIDEIMKALEATNDALFNADLTLALKICRSEFKTDALYKTHFQQITNDIKDGSHTREIQNLITALFIFRYLERIGDSLLNIGEAIISSILGEKLKIHQYEALEEGLSHAVAGSLNGNVNFASMGETRSGCRIGLVQPRDINSQGRRIIFKDGKLDKIRREKEGIEKWEALIPGIPPKIYDYTEHGPNASILLECLQGNTFQENLINGKPDLIMNMVAKICQTCDHIWQTTLKKRTLTSGFIDQLIARLDDVHLIHPVTQNQNQFIGKTPDPSLDSLLDSARKLEANLSCPFSVLIHGDFNVDNIILNLSENQIHYIDLHRSAEKDYLQDASVFLVSIFRLPTANGTKGLFYNDVLKEFFEFCEQFAQKNNDSWFEARLALGLARSFITSTRFELNRYKAEDMFHRGVYLLKKVVGQDPEALSTFHIPSFAITF